MAMIVKVIIMIVILNGHSVVRIITGQDQLDLLEEALWAHDGVLLTDKLVLKQLMLVVHFKHLLVVLLKGCVEHI